MSIKAYNILDIIDIIFICVLIQYFLYLQKYKYNRQTYRKIDRQIDRKIDRREEEKVQNDRKSKIERKIGQGWLPVPSIDRQIDRYIGRQMPEPQIYRSIDIYIDRCQNHRQIDRQKPEPKSTLMN